MRADALTEKQRQLVRELCEVLAELGVWPISLSEEQACENMLHMHPALRTEMLEGLKKRLVRGEVVFEYSLMDDKLSYLITRHLFEDRRPVGKIWKTEKGQAFYHFILEKLSFLNKLDFVGNTHNIPKRLKDDFQKLNVLRNSLAHSYLTEYRRKVPEWKGKSIFTVEGVGGFKSDMVRLDNLLMQLIQETEKKKRDELH